MIFPIIAAIASAVQFVFTSGNFFAQAIRFVAGTVLFAMLGKPKNVEGPRIADLHLQGSQYGTPIPRIYGECVRIAGNVIDKSDLIETYHKKKKKMLGFTLTSQKWYTYSASLAILLAEGALPAAPIRKIYAQGKVIFDREAGDAPTLTAQGGYKWTRAEGAHDVFKSVTFYPGTATQGVDPIVQSFHGSDPVPAYRHTAYVVIERIELQDWGNSIPNLEFEVETSFPTLGDTLHDLCSAADVEVHTGQLETRPLRGYAVGSASSVWGALEPLAGTFSFDMVAQGDTFRCIERGKTLRTILTEGDFAARPADSHEVKDTISLDREDPIKYPDEVVLTYFDVDRDYQTNTQRAFRNEGYSKNKMSVEVPLALTAAEAADVVWRTLSESLAAIGEIKLYLNAGLRWLQASNLVGVPIGDQIHTFRIGDIKESPNGVLEVSGAFDDALSYVQDQAGAVGIMPGNPLTLVGETIMQPIDAAILNDETDTGFYYAVVGTGAGWRGCEIYRADGTGSPLTFELIFDPGLPAIIGECTTTLADGATDVWDHVNSVTVSLYGTQTLESVTESDVLVQNANFAWIGAPDGEGGEYINFLNATPGGSPTVWTLSGLLRGRRGTEFATAGHGSGERFVLMEQDPINRIDFGPVDWNITNTYQPVSVFQDQDDAATFEFTNTGEGKRPYAPVHLEGVRNGTNNDILLQWERRTRLNTPALAAGPVPLGEETEAYEIDIYSGSPLVVVRTLTATTPSVNYTAAMQTADGHTGGALVHIDVYQMSGVRGRGHVASGYV